MNELILSTSIGDNPYAPFRATSITRAGTTATFTAARQHHLSTGATVTINGADLAQYNGQYIINVTGVKTFTYVMASDPGGSANVANVLASQFGAYNQQGRELMLHPTSRALMVDLGGLAAGAFGHSIISGTGVFGNAAATPQWGVIYNPFATAAVFTDLQGDGVPAGWSGLSLPQGSSVPGRFSLIQLSSGSLIAFLLS
jgi:hypothetical protein